MLPAGNKIQTLSSRPRGCFATPRSPRLARRFPRLGACKKTGARSFPRARNFAWGVGSEREREEARSASPPVCSRANTSLVLGSAWRCAPCVPRIAVYQVRSRQSFGANVAHFWCECAPLGTTIFKWSSHSSWRPSAARARYDPVQRVAAAAAAAAMTTTAAAAAAAAAAHSHAQSQRRLRVRA